jgi:alpha/beta superfamily hydrolase
VVVKNAQHFFEGRDDELARVIVGFLDHAFRR